MPAPSLPGLLFNSLSGLAGTTIPLWLALLVTTGNTVTADDGASIPATARHVFTSPNANVVLAVPAASSPVAGKYVLIWAYESGVAPGASAVLSPEVATATVCYFGIWMADAGSTVSAADLTAAWSTNAADGGFTGNGTFSGYSKFYAGTIPNNVYVFVSDDYVVVQLEETTNGTFWCWGGMGVRCPTVAGGESGMGGRRFDFGTSGTTAVVAAHTTNQGNGCPTGHGTSAGNSHWWHRLPGQTTGSSTTTMRAMSWRIAGGTPVGFQASDPLNCVDDTGAVEPEIMPLKDVSGGTQDKKKVGRSRAFFFGPRAKTKSILAAAGVKKWIAVGQAVSTANDAFLLPYA